MLVVLAFGAGACALGGVPTGELPDEPIAIIYRTPEEARRNAEDYADREARAGKRRTPTQARPSRGGYGDLVASEENVSEFVERLFGYPR